MRHIQAAALACAILGLAPAVRAQAAEPLVSRVGSPVAHRIGLPAGWQVVAEDGKLMAVGGDAVIIVSVVDLVTHPSNRLPLSPGEARRHIMAAAGSDSAQMAMLEHNHRERNMPLEGAVREFRTLGGHRAAFIGGRLEEGSSARVEAYTTLEDAILYMVVFIGEAASFARNESLYRRVRDSLVLAPAPPR